MTGISTNANRQWALARVPPTKVSTTVQAMTTAVNTPMAPAIRAGRHHRLQVAEGGPVDRTEPDAGDRHAEHVDDRGRRHHHEQVARRSDDQGRHQHHAAAQAVGEEAGGDGGGGDRQGLDAGRQRLGAPRHVQGRLAPTSAVEAMLGHEPCTAPRSPRNGTASLEVCVTVGTREGTATSGGGWTAVLTGAPSLWDTTSSAGPCRPSCACQINAEGHRALPATACPPPTSIVGGSSVTVPSTPPPRAL